MLQIKVSGVRQRKHTPTPHRLHHYKAQKCPSCRYQTEPRRARRTLAQTRNSMALTILTLRCAMMMILMMMMMMTVTHAAPQKGKVGSHHKSPNSEDESPKFFILGDLEQEIKPAKHSIRPIHNNSISPWEITYITDPDQIPSQLPQAHCLLKGCLNWNGVETMELLSKPITLQVLVLKRVRRGDDKNYYFRLEHKNISVGCTCVRPNVEQI